MIYALIAVALYAPLVWWVYNLHRKETEELAAVGWTKALNLGYAIAFAWLYALAMVWFYCSVWPGDVAHWLRTRRKAAG